MIGKLAINNVKKSYNIYFVYIFTLVLTIALFYGFNAMGSSKAIITLQKENAVYTKTFLTIIKYTSYFISFFIVFLMVYASDFFFKVRSKEYFVYKTLGMSKKEFIKLIFLENIIVAIISLVFGLILGVFINYALNASLVNFLGVTGVNNLSFSIDSFIKTTIYFLILILIISLFSSFKLNKKTIMDLKNFKEELKRKNHNIIFNIVLFVIAIISLSIAYYLGYISNLNILSLSFKLCFFFGIFGTVLIHISIINIITVLIKKKKANKNTFKNALISSRLSKNKLSISIISLSFVLILTTIFGGYSFIGLSGIEDLPQNDAEILIFDSPSPIDIDYIKYGFKEEQITNIDSYTYYPYEGELFLTYMSSSDFKELQKDGYMEEDIELEDYTYIKGEDLVSYDSDGEITGEKFNNVGMIDRLGIEDVKIVEDKEITIPKFSTGFLVVKDSLIDSFSKRVPDIENQYKDQWIYFQYEDKEDEAKFKKLADDIFGSHDKSGYANTKQEILKGKLVFKVSILFIVMYISFFLVIISLAVLAIQQVMDAIDNKEEYKKIKILGMNNKEIKKVIRKNTNTYFVFPLIVASISTFFALLCIDKFIVLVSSKSLYTYLNQNLYIIILVLVIIYIVYIELVKTIYFKIVEV